VLFVDMGAFGGDPSVEFGDGSFWSLKSGVGGD
jgi:hypothetical protein